ncbi:MAG TPA: hypothetical protein VLW85_22435 [Myxococcales bacterium]|nr:hypothetical protein [Myxococcales bacterium]
MSLCRVGFLALACVACSTTPAITLVATPNPVPGDGVTKITITAVATEGGSPSSGATVHFKTSLGAFDGATGDGSVIDQTADDQGQAIVTMSAPRQGFGTIDLTASFSSQGSEPTATFSLPLTPSGGSAASISFTCTSHNVGALVFNRQTDIHMLCRATAFDASNHVIAHASVQTLSEAGSLDWLDDSTGVQEFVYTVRPDDKPPKDVMPCDTATTIVNGRGYCKEQDTCPTGCNANPFDTNGCAGEPCYLDTSGITHNPRDGVATLVAAVPGVKGFDDQGEPFVDMNDNGVRDADEPFIDYNGNGKYDGPDGTLKDRMAWKEFRVIWSGAANIPPSTGGNTHSSYIVQNQNNNVNLTAVFVDLNLNALAADGAAGTDGYNWEADNCTGGAADGTPSPAGTAMDQVDPGIAFQADTGEISAPNQRTTYSASSTATAMVSQTSMVGQTCTVTVTPSRCNDPGAPGYDPSCEGTDNGVVGVFTF